MSPSKLIVAACILALCSSGSLSAQTTDFKGPYVGVNVGGTTVRSAPATSTVFSPTGYFAQSSVPAVNTVGQQSVNPSNYTVGAQLGYNFQFGRTVLGLEADFTPMNLTGTATGGATYPCCAPTAFTVNQSVSAGGMTTFRGRLGVVAGKTLVYLTGGTASTKMTYSAVFTDTFATAHENGGISQTRSAAVWGGGLESMVTRRFSVKAEFLYANFGTVATTSTNLTAFTPPIAFPTNVFTHSVNLTASIVHVGLNFHF